MTLRTRLDALRRAVASRPPKPPCPSDVAFAALAAALDRMEAGELPEGGALTLDGETILRALGESGHAQSVGAAVQ